MVGFGPGTGDFVWQYPFSPNDRYGRDATEFDMLVDLEIDGQNRKALAQASTDPAVGLRRAVEKIGPGRAQIQRSCALCDGRNTVNAGTTSYDLRKFPVDDAERFKHSVTQGKGNRPSFKQSLAPEQVAVLWATLGPVAARNPSKADKLRNNLCGRVAALAVCVGDDNPPLSYQVNLTGGNSPVRTAKPKAALSSPQRSASAAATGQSNSPSPTASRCPTGCCLAARASATT